MFFLGISANGRGIREVFFYGINNQNFNKMDELKNQRGKTAKWNDQQTKSEEAGLKNSYQQKEVFSQQKNISSNPIVIGSVCEHHRWNWMQDIFVGFKYCLDCKKIF